MEKDYLKEAFKALEELNEDVFDISLSDGLEDAKEFMEEPVDDREEEIIIDPLAETEEDLEKDYLGKAILQCEICQSMIYKNPDEVVIDEEVGLANIDEVCPFCQSEDGFKVIGQIEEFCDDEECEHKDNEDKEDKGEEEIEVNETEEDEEEIEESIKTRKKLRLKESKKLKEDWDWDGDLPKIADEMAKAFDKMDFISRDDFDEQFALACRKILGIDNIWEEDTITIDGKKRDILGDVEPDIRVILSLQNNYETEFGGDNEGGLRLVESKSRDDIDADADNKKEKAKKILKRKLDDADSIKDERKKSAKKQFKKAQDDADADRDYKLKKKGLKESKRLNESVYSEVQEFLKDATKYFKDSEEGCYYTPVTSDLYLVAGYPSDEDRPYVKIAFNDSSLQSDYEWDWNMPTYSDGEIALVEISLKDNDLERDAKYLVREAQSMQKEIDKGNLLLESCKSKKSKKSLKESDNVYDVRTKQGHTFSVKSKDEDSAKDWVNKNYRKTVKGDFDIDRVTKTNKTNISESDKPASISIQDAQKWVDYDMKKYGEISNRTNRLVKKAGFRIDKDQYGDYEVVAGTYESCNEDTRTYINNKKEIKESFKNLQVLIYDNNGKKVKEETKPTEHDAISFGIDELSNNKLYKYANILTKGGSVYYSILNAPEEIEKAKKLLKEDTIKRDGKWMNKGKEGTHGKFRTKKEADAQRKAMFANGYKEGIEEEYELTDADVKRIGKTNAKNQWAFSNKDLLRLARQHKRAKMQNDEKTMARIEYRLDDANFHKEASLLNNGQYDKLFKMLKEDFNKVDIETDREKMSMTADENGKVTVTTEPKNDIEEVSETDEVIAPVSNETKAEFKSSEEETEDEDTFTDVDFDEFEEKDFDELGESYLRKVYENVRGFKTTKGTISGNKLKLEGVITFKSGKQAKTDFIFEAYNATKTGKLKFIGENKQFAKGKKSFTLTGKVDGNKLVCESLNYSYVGKSADGTSKRLYGTVRK